MFKYQIAVNVLKDEIMSDRWRPGDAFLGIHDICRRFNVAHLTAVKIIKCLEALRLVESRRGSGTYISRQRKSIVFLSPAIGLAPFFHLIRKEISDVCLKNGILFRIHEVDGISRADFPQRLRKAAQKLIGSKPSGIIYLPSANITPTQDCISPADNVDREILADFNKASIPVILIDSGIESPLEDHYDLVGVDNRAIGIKIGQHLLSQKARNVMFVHWKSRSPNVRDRNLGMKDVVLAAGIPFSTYELTKSNIKDFLQLLKSPRRPDAIACTSDRIAIAILHLLRKARIDVPGDILLTGVDDTEQAQATPPGLTTVRQPYRDIARAACEMLLSRIARPGMPPRHLTISTALIPRGSTARHSGETEDAARQ